MCRSIKQLRVPEGPPTEAEIEAAALQFVRKVTGFRKPSRANREAFERAVAEVAEATRRVIEEMTAPGAGIAAEEHP